MHPSLPGPCACKPRRACPLQTPPTGTWRLACCVLQVAKPTAVSRAEATAGDLGEEQVLEAITAYQLAVGQYGALARSLLPSYGGYECKEPEPGKFTMAFG